MAAFGGKSVAATEEGGVGRVGEELFDNPFKVLAALKNQGFATAGVGFNIGEGFVGVEGGFGGETEFFETRGGVGFGATADKDDFFGFDGGD